MRSWSLPAYAKTATEYTSDGDEMVSTQMDKMIEGIGEVGIDAEEQHWQSWTI